MSDSFIYQSGNIATDPEVGYTNSGTAYYSFRLAVSKRRFNREANRWEDGDTSYYTVKLWRHLAENAGMSNLARGMRVIVVGESKMRSFTRNDGSKGVDFEIEASDFGPSLKFDSAQVVKNQRGGNNHQTQAPQGGQGNPQGGWNNSGNAQGRQQAPANTGGQPDEQDPFGANSFGDSPTDW